MSEPETDALRSAIEAQVALQRETDHRVKNILQLISSVILLQGRRATDPMAQAALKSVLQRVSAISVASRHIERAADGELTDLTALVREIATELASSAGREAIAVDLDLEPVSLPARHGAPLALVLSEALANALVHGYPDGRAGRVQVVLHRQPAGFVLRVSDDGVGVPEGGPTKGFGLTILQLMVQQLRARLETTTQPGFSLAVHVAMDQKPKP
jgi:two-component sensor histidine kinase